MSIDLMKQRQFIGMAKSGVNRIVMTMYPSCFARHDSVASAIFDTKFVDVLNRIIRSLVEYLFL